MTEAVPSLLPPVVTPQLELIEEVVLLSLHAPHAAAWHAARVAARAYPDQPADHRDAVKSLEHKGMLKGSGVLHRQSPTPRARVNERLGRIRVMIRTAAAPTGTDAELFALLAAAGALPIERAQDHLHARLRLSDIGQHDAVPPAVAALAQELDVSTMRELANKLLPPNSFPLADHASTMPISYTYSAFL